MIIAQQKRKENIVEYLIYMWQVEDMIRACQWDMELIDKHIVSHYEQSEHTKANIRVWYQDLIGMMRNEGVLVNGHLKIIKSLVSDLCRLHSRLLAMPEETAYLSLYYQTLPVIVQLRSKSEGNKLSEVETCLTALYGFVLLKLQHREISEDTENAVRQVSSFLALLAAKYKHYPCSD